MESKQLIVYQPPLKFDIQEPSPPESFDIPKSTEHDLKKQCMCCGKDSPKNRLCSKCKTVYYCDEKCQKNDYRIHKKECKHRAKEYAEKKQIRKEKEIELQLTKRELIDHEKQKLIDWMSNNKKLCEFIQVASWYLRDEENIVLVSFTNKDIYEIAFINKYVVRHRFNHSYDKEEPLKEYIYILENNDHYKTHINVKRKYRIGKEKLTSRMKQCSLEILESIIAGKQIINEWSEKLCVCCHKELTGSTHRVMTR